MLVRGTTKILIIVRPLLFNDSIVFITHLAHIIPSRMDDNTSSNDVIDTIETEDTVNHVQSSNAISVCNNVSQISNMSMIITRSSMLQLEHPNGSPNSICMFLYYLEWIEVTLHWLASICHITKLMDVKTMIAWCQTFDSSCNFNWSCWASNLKKTSRGS